MIPLRGHHLVCLQFFTGQGYDKPFQEMLQDLLQRAAGDLIRITDGPDEVCQACPYLKGERCTHPETSDAEIREMDRVALEILSLTPGAEIKWPTETQARLKEGFGRWAREFCEKCSWRPACEQAPDFLALINQTGKFS